MGKAQSKEHDGHVRSSLVMRGHGVGGPRGKAAKIVDVVTAFVVVVKGVGGVQGACFHKTVEAVSRELGAKPSGFTEGAKYECC